jgi:hypothetical protein
MWFVVVLVAIAVIVLLLSLGNRHAVSGGAARHSDEPQAHR